MTAVTPGTAAAATMTAIAQDEYGTAPQALLRLAGITRPAIAADEIQVRVRAASVDRGTWHLMAGLPYPMRPAGSGLRRPKAPNPGRSLAGTVESAGPKVTGFKPGHEVHGTCDGSDPRPLGPGEIISHAGLGPWNTVYRDGIPVALIDWDAAQPVDPVADLAATAWTSRRPRSSRCGSSVSNLAASTCSSISINPGHTTRLPAPEHRKLVSANRKVASPRADRRLVS
jgi:hypothetical protein